MDLRVSTLMLTGCLLLAGCNGSPVAATGAGPALKAVQATPDETATASGPDSPLPRGPVLTPEQVWDKLLAMIDAIEQREDLNKQNMERAIGLKLHKRPGETHSDLVIGDTTAGWLYVFDLVAYTDSDISAWFRPRRLDMGAGRNSPTCTWRTEKLRAALRERGFDEESRIFTDRSYFNWQYTRGPMVVDVRYYFDRQHLDYTNTCVDSVLVSFVIPEFYKEAT